ncbi:MAG: DNA mismatch repair protein MutL, partial [Dehalococcoidia bacterium]
PPPALRPPGPVQPRLSGYQPSQDPPDTARPTHREVLPLLRVVGQMANTYVIAEAPDGMYLLDQHAAHERVVYERVIAEREATGRGPVQALLDPVMLELDVPLAAVLEEHREQLEGLGLATEPFGESAYLLRTVPGGLGSTDIGAQVRRLLEQLAGERRVQDPFQRAAATVACHASVRAGMAMSLGEMRRLLEDLEETVAPRTCPHGRPTLIHLSSEALERSFGRR